MSGVLLAPWPRFFLDVEGIAFAVLGRGSTIFVYNRQYEVKLFNDVAALVRQLAEEIGAVIARIVDLLPLTRAAYYHPAMKGSWSLKAVLPSVAPELAYDTLDEVQDGQGAQLAYLQLINPEPSSARKARLAASLREYCRRDTLGLVRLARVLAGA